MIYDKLKTCVCPIAIINYTSYSFKSIVHIKCSYYIISIYLFTNIYLLLFFSQRNGLLKEELNALMHSCMLTKARGQVDVL